MKLYTIKPGKSRTDLISVIKNSEFFTKKTSVSYRVKFTESCIYDLINKDSYGVNKLFGLTFGIFGVHKNSVRFGWKPFSKDVIMIYAYTYNKGVRKETQFLKVKTNEYLEMNIEVKKDKYIFKIKSLDKLYTSVLEVQHNSIVSFGYVNFLYIGGTKKVNQNIMIGMEKIKSLVT